jgi:starch phosphorylase
MLGTHYSLEVNPHIPPRLARLSELAANLWYSWDRATRTVFARLHPALWDAVAHNPKALLRRVDERRLLKAAGDAAFLANFERVLASYDAYHSDTARRAPPNAALARDDLVAYFCAEFGFHESMPIYSGGLGILSADHCKAASDARLPFVAVGLLYRQGYFIQKIDGDGNQRAEYFDSDFEDLPVSAVRREGGAELTVSVGFPGRDVLVKVWQVRIGHVRLFLLDTDLAENGERDRHITHQLYGGDRTTRLEQEIVLGVGGVRALAAMGLRPTVWHLNEGHPAFAILERVRALVDPKLRAGQALELDAAIENVAAGTVFTTHTAVAAGHDHFPDSIAAPYLARLGQDLGLDPERVASLGRPPAGGDFNMTALAVRGSRFQNGVSRIHGGVSAHMLREHWPQVPEEENPVGYVTNGVHIPTFLAPEWAEAFDRFLGPGWAARLADPATGDRIRALPDAVFWEVRRALKSQMLHMIRHRMSIQHSRNHGSASRLDRLLRYADPDRPEVLTIGFARRFATYKRAQLLFGDLDVLRSLFGDSERPLLFIFAGKAHPADQPGQDLIRAIARVAKLPEFEGKILLLEGYELHLARRLVAGVDVWLNNPIYPLEASGTSGMKAGMNGVVNLSVLDGWWAEGYDGTNGWAIQPASPALPPEVRDSEESRTLYETLRERLIPLYYDRRSEPWSPGWLAMAKNSMATILPRYNATRMLEEYAGNFYGSASRQGRRYAADGFSGAKLIASWKARVRAAWPRVSARRVDQAARRVEFGSAVKIEVAVQLSGLAPQDIAVELLLGRRFRDEAEVVSQHLAPVGEPAASGEQMYAIDLKPEMCGKLEYRIRAYPRHELLTHRFEMGLMYWI